jgi:hypothetical protein
MDGWRDVLRSQADIISVGQGELDTEPAFGGNFHDTNVGGVVKRLVGLCERHARPAETLSMVRRSCGKVVEHTSIHAFFRQAPTHEDNAAGLTRIGDLNVRSNKFHLATAIYIYKRDFTPVLKLSVLWNMNNMGGSLERFGASFYTRDQIKWDSSFSSNSNWMWLFATMTRLLQPRG